MHFWSGGDAGVGGGSVELELGLSLSKSPILKLY
jgi:hypothetical protein